jgi:hypothetical protein
MAAALHRFLCEDHSRLDGFLARTLADPNALDLAAYTAFRGGLLRHIAMEEKLLMPEAKRLRGGEALPVAARLRRDHATLASLLVPTPTGEILGLIREILEPHNELEEGSGGLYEVCDVLLGADAEALSVRLAAMPEVPLARHFDGPRIHAHIAELLRARNPSRA